MNGSKVQPNHSSVKSYNNEFCSTSIARSSISNYPIHARKDGQSKATGTEYPKEINEKINLMLPSK